MEQPAASVTVIGSSVLTENVATIPKMLDRNFMNLESHQLVWLASQHNHDSISIETLRNITDYTKPFIDIDACEEYTKSSHETIFMMISNEFSQDLLPRIHDLNQILAIYIYDTISEEKNKHFASQFSKVKIVARSMDVLLEKLGKDVQTFLKQDRNLLINNNDPSSLSKEEMTLGDGFSWWSPFLDLLLYHLPYSKEECLQKLSNTMKQYYQGNRIDVEGVEKFEKNYRAAEAVQWYTRDTFVYRVLNKALRQRNITLLFLFGFFVQDVYNQLKGEHEKSQSEHLSSELITTYRGQTMWNEEIELIRNGYDKIVNWCFFSTTRDLDVARLYLNDSIQPNHLQNVLFEVKIDPAKSSYPYADISNISHMSDESEILFMIGTAFRVMDVIYDETERFWRIKLELEQDKRKLTEDYSLVSTNNNNCKRTSLKGAVRNLLQRFDSTPTHDINTLFDDILELFPAEKNWLTAIKFHCLANHAENRYEITVNRFKSRIDNYREALKIWWEYKNDTELNCFLDIADIHREIAECYTHHFVKKDWEAEFHYNLALENYQMALQNEFIVYYEKSDVYEKLDDIYQIKIDHGDNKAEVLGMVIKNREDYVEHLSKPCHPNNAILAESLRKLAQLYKSVQRYDEALVNYKKALELYRSQTPPDSYWSLLLAKEITDIYTTHKDDHNSTLIYQEIIRDIESQKTSKLGHFMTAAKRHKERDMD